MKRTYIPALITVFIILLAVIGIYSIKFAEEKISVSYCNNIRDPDYNKMCLAIIKQNPELCMQIQDSDSRDRCYNYIAIIKQDSSECKQIKEKISEDWCYYYVSRIKQDISLCGEIGDASLKEECKNKTKI